MVNSSIWDAIKWPCSWTYKGNHVSTTEEAEFWIVIRAKCTCGNKIILTCPNPPPVDPNTQGLTLDLKIWGSKEQHFSFKEKLIRKRPIAGEKRRSLGDEMVDNDIKSSRKRKILASEMIEFGDLHPAHLPSHEVLRRVRYENLKNRRLDHDPVRAIQLLKYSDNPLYQFSIRDIGLDPFFVHITSPDQLKLYNSYCNNSYSRLIIDATGKLVQK